MPKWLQYIQFMPKRLQYVRNVISQQNVHASSRGT